LLESSPGLPRLTMREAILKAIEQEMARDDRVVVIGQDIGTFGGPLKSTEGLLDAFGGARLLEMPIAEGSMTTVATGAALFGMRPIVEIMFSDLLPAATTALVQVAGAFRWMSDSAATVPIVIRTRGGDGPYRAHPQNYEAIFMHAPGVTVVTPSNCQDAWGLMRSAIRSDSPVLFIENIHLYNGQRQPLDTNAPLVPLGEAHVVREGADATVIAYGRAVRTALTAARGLAQQGIEIEVIDLRTLSPLDDETILSSVRKTGRVVTVHEAWTDGGLGAELVARVCERGMPDLRSSPVRLGAPPVSIPWAEPLRDATIPDVAGISRAVLQVVQVDQSIAR
jgi:pyruvate/2-oxoglutarate/acetoin dehydrogenase E1 component